MEGHEKLVRLLTQHGAEYKGKINFIFINQKQTEEIQFVITIYDNLTNIFCYYYFTTKCASIFQVLRCTEELLKKVSRLKQIIL